MSSFNSDIIRLTPSGMYCEAGDFYIDPWQPVSKAIITHAHSDHARLGSTKYLAAEPGKRILRTRLGFDSNIETIAYNQSIKIGDVNVSFHPAGHVLGSAQVRVEHKGEVWVASGDYKIEVDKTCAQFEPVKCDVFITESTFGLPIYRWASDASIFAQINQWWQKNREQGRSSVLYAYALGKSQRVLAGIDSGIGPIYTHGAVENITTQYRESGVSLPETTYVGSLPKGTKYEGAMIIAPPSAQGSPWTRQFNKQSSAFASGWMRIRGTRRRKSVDRGFALSDHADWDGLNAAIAATGASRVIVTHGYSSEFVKWLLEKGLSAQTMSTKFEGEGESEKTGDIDSETES
jgi:putative mRNA 3-end processing factor